jgi:hypothetical protein
VMNFDMEAPLRAGARPAESEPEEVSQLPALFEPSR